MKRVLLVDLSELRDAFEEGLPGVHWYLDVETGEVISVDDEMWRLLERVGEGDGVRGRDGGALIAPTDALQRHGVLAWQWDLLQEAARVEAGLGTRYIEVPRAGSRDGFQDMEDFVGAIRDTRMRERLAATLGGRGSFRRFEDALADYSAERDRWPAFAAARVRGRILGWLDSEDIAPILA